MAFESPLIREKVSRGVVTGEVKVVAGGRSVLFLPFEDLGLIIVDEERDPAYKQEDAVFYNARDMAVVRAGSAIFRSYWFRRRFGGKPGQWSGRRYNTVHLPTRFGDAAMPDLHLIDRKPPRRILNPAYIAFLSVYAGFISASAGLLPAVPAQ